LDLFSFFFFYFNIFFFFFYIFFFFFFFLYKWIYIRFYNINLKFISIIYRIFGLFIYSLGSFDFLVNSFRVICISLLQVFLLFVEPDNKKLIKQAPQYLIYTRVSSVIFLIGTLILRIYLSSNLRDLWFLAHEVPQTPLLKFRTVCLLVGLCMKRGIFPFSFYHLPVYEQFSMPILFFSQSILKLVYGSFFLKYFAFCFALNSYFVLWFLFIRIVRSLLYSSVRALLEKSFNLFIVFSGFANFRFFLIPCLANNYNTGKTVLRFFNFNPLIYGCGYLLIYILGILRFFYFISTYPDLVSDNINSFSKLKNCANSVKRKFVFILIYLSSVPPSPLFFFKVKILLDFLALSTNYFFFFFFFFLGSLFFFFFFFFFLIFFFFFF